MSGLTRYRRIDDDDHAPVQRLAIRSVGRHRVGVAVTEGLEASRGHPVREEPVLDGLGTQQGKLKIAAWSGKAIGIAVDARRGTRQVVPSGRRSDNV